MTNVLRNRSILIMGTAESVSGIGNWITMMSVFALLVFRGEGGVVESTGVFVAGLLPMLVVSPVAGRLADRLDRKWIMMGSEFLNGLTVAALIVVQRVEFIYPLLALSAVFSSFLTPARQAAVVNLVDRQDLTRTNAFLGQLAGIVKIGAPLLAGMILVVLSPYQAMVLDVLSFALSVLILSRLPALPPPLAREEPSRFAATPRATPNTFGVVRRSPRLALLFAVAFCITFITMEFDVLASIYTRDVLGGNESLFGLLIGLIGIGTVVVTTGLLLLRAPQNPWRDAIAGLVLLAFVPGSLAAATLVRSPALSIGLAIAGCLVGGLGNGLLLVQSGTLLQLLAPPRLLGTLSGIFQSTFVAGQMVALLTTPILIPSILSVRLLFGIDTLALLLLAAGILVILRRTAPEFQGAPGSAQALS